MAKHRKSNIILFHTAGYGKIIELLIQHGVNIHAKNPGNDKTALILAIENGNFNDKLYIIKLAYILQ